MSSAFLLIKIGTPAARTWATGVPLIQDRLSKSGEHGAGVRDGHDADDDRIDDAGNVRVLRGFVNHTGDDRRAEED